MSRLSSAHRAEELSVVHGVDAIVLEGNPSSLPSFHPQCVVVGITTADDPSPFFDTTFPSRDQADEFLDAVEASATAALTLTQLLRHNEHASVYDGLLAESLAYSTLQHGAQFERWLEDHVAKNKPDPTSPHILIDPRGDELHLTLNRPEKRNAWSTPMRDALAEALAMLDDDESIQRAFLTGAGPCFGAGGDLDEFGSATDAAEAHITRMTRSPAYLLHKHRNRITAQVHGACVGAGIELPAFVSRVEAHPDSFFQLPEVGMGLIPGAGGTASILPRIGRHRLNWMAITGKRVDCETAIRWGLVDAVQTKHVG